MKKWVWIIIGLVVIFLILGWLYDQGYIKTNWQWLTIILAAAAGPFEFIRKMFTGETASTKKILTQQQKRIQTVDKHRQIYEKIIKQKEQKIQELEAEVEKLQSKIDTLELEKKQVDTTVEQMDLNELRDTFIDEFGEE